jgi:hypothetical protein
MPKARHFEKVRVTRVSEVVLRNIAERCLVACRRRVCPNADNMSAAELRGYVRARAMRPVRMLVRQLVSEARLPARQADHAIAWTLDRTVHEIVCEMTARPLVRMSNAHVPLRLAG